MSTIPEAIREAAIADYVAGASVADAAARHGVSVKSVQRWIKARGQSRPRGPREGSSRIPAETRARAVQMYRDGTGAEAVGAALGVSATAVTVWVKAAGYAMRPPGRCPSHEEVATPIPFEGRWVRRGLVLYPVRGEAS